MKSTVLIAVLIALVATTYANPYVVFRLDDIQDYWITDAQQAVINVFKNANLPMTVGIIANDFGTDDTIVNYIKQCLADSQFPLEIANHGWNHEDFTTFTLSQQVTLLSESKTKTVGQLSAYIHDITTFIPPFDSFNANTITAMQTTGYNAISSDTSFYGTDDEGNPCSNCGARPYPGTGAVREYPAGSGTNDLYDGYVIDVDESMAMIERQIGVAGFSVVMMHFNWYSYTKSNGDTAVNATMITMLQQLVQQCQSKGYTFTTIGGLTQALAGGSSSSSSSSSSTTHAAASTTHAATPVTTQAATPVTTHAATPATTKKVSTTSAPTRLTTGRMSTTGAPARITTGRSSTTTTTGASGSCTTGNMKCLTSETFSTCAHSAWGVSQSCSPGTTCHQAGAYIYCY